MLQGTFETLSLPEVLGLLASARKSGALWLEAGSVSGVVHVEDGHCRAVESAERREPVDHGTILLDRLVEVCFGAVRQENGSFRFAADEPAPWRCPEPVELSDALVEVERLLKQWREVVRMIPSLDCRPRLLDALVGDQLVVDRDLWSLLVAVDGRRTVRDVVARVGRPVLEVCHWMLELVEAGAIGILDPEPAHAVPDLRPVDPPVEGAPQPEPCPEPEPRPEFAPRPPVVEPTVEPASLPPVEPDPAPAARAEPPARAVEPPPTPPPAVEPVAPAPEPVAAASEPVADRGAFLRLFSGLRET